jgi:hypothetical protein
LTNERKGVIIILSKEREVNKMRKIDELTTEEYIDVVIASGSVKNFKNWCKRHNIDYEDAMEYDWN